MTELETLAQRAVEQLAASTPDPERVGRRGAVLRRRRRTGRGVLAGAVLAAAVSVGIVFAGHGATQQVATAPPPSTTPSVTTLPPGWQKATPHEVRSALGADHLGGSPSFLATWSVMPAGTHTHAATVVSGQAGNGVSFYRITPTAAVPGLLLPDHGTPGHTYAYYFRPGTTNAQVSCSTAPDHPQSWTCLSWTGVPGVGMSVDATLREPNPSYSAADAVGSLLYKYGYTQTGNHRATPTPAYLTHRDRLGLNLTCFRFGSATHPTSSVCVNHGLVTSYHIPQSVLSVDGGAVYLSIRMTNHQPNPPAADFDLPAALSAPNSHS